jgi:hypothetical protein
LTECTETIIDLYEDTIKAKDAEIADLTAKLEQLSTIKKLE